MKKSEMGLLNISLPWHVNARCTIDVSSSGGEWSKKSVQQGRSPFDTGAYTQYVSTAKGQPAARSRFGEGRERRWRLFSTFPKCHKRGKRSTTESQFRSVGEPAAR